MTRSSTPRPAAGRHPALAVAVAAVLGVLAAVVAAPLAHAQAPAASLQLVAQKLVIAPEEPLTATFAVAGTPPEGAQLTVVVSSRLRSPRADLHALLDEGGELGGTVDILSLPLTEVPRDAVGRLSVTIPTVRRSSADSRESLRFSAPGLYPVTFELRTAEDDTVASLLTFVERRDDALTAAPLAVALVASVSSPPAGQVNGTIAVDERARTDLTQLAAALQHNPSVPATVSLPPELLSRLATSTSPEDQELVQKLAEVLPGRQLLSRPYVTMDPSASARSGLAPDYTRLLAQGEDTLRELFPGVTPDRTQFLAQGPIDDAGLQLLRNLGTLNVVLPPAPVAADDAPADPRDDVDVTRTVQLLVGDGSVVRASVLDRAVLQRVVGTPDPVLAAHYLAVELLALQSEQPDQAGRGVAVVLPEGWPIDAVLLGTLEDLLGQIPELHPVELGVLFAGTGAATDGGGGTLAIPPPGGPVADRSDLAAAVAQRRLSVGQVTSMLDDGGALEGDLASLLDLALAEDLSSDRRDGIFATVDSDLAAVTGSIVPMDRRQFTITSRRTTIPITVRTSWPGPLRVKVRLTSPKLRFPEGDQIITVTDDSPPFRVPVEAKSNGTFQVTATLLTPEGDAPLGPPMTITVRSTALSGLGILVTIAAGLVLAAWWFQHVRGKRRRRAALAAAGRHPTSPLDRPPAEVGGASS